MPADLMGTDLVVVNPIANVLGANDASVCDLVLTPTRSVGILAAGATEAADLAVLSGRANLAHALLLRLLTPVGSLAALGHAGYGSRLHLLVGQRKNEANRNLCRVYLLEAVAQEPRIDPKAVSVTFDPVREAVDSFVVLLAVQPLDGGAPVGLTLGVGL
jgi:phage baseplate assembly protein W